MVVASNPSGWILKAVGFDIGAPQQCIKNSPARALRGRQYHTFVPLGGSLKTKILERRIDSNEVTMSLDRSKEMLKKINEFVSHTTVRSNLLTTKRILKGSIFLEIVCISSAKNRINRKFNV